MPHELPPSTSASQLSCYAQCPRRYAYRYVERREPERRGTGLCLGSAVGGAVAWWFNERVEGREPVLDDALAILRADLCAALAYPNVEWKDETPESLRADAEKLLRLFVAECGVLPVVETELRIDMPIIDPDTGETMPRPLVGFFDLELRDGGVVELKTAAKAYSANDLRVNLQFACYRTAIKYFSPADVELIALIKTKTPRVQRATLRADRHIATWFMRAAAQIERGILAGVFPPSPGPMCSSCEYRVACLGEEVADVEAEAA